MKIVTLSKNLTLDEMLHTDTGVHNYSRDDQDWKLFIMARFLFQPIRDQFGPIKVTSGFRSPVVNRAVGGVPTSQHALAEAMDLVPLSATCEEVFLWIIDNLKFGQVIHEKVQYREWIHLSMVRSNKENQQALTYDGKDYKMYKKEIKP